MAHGQPAVITGTWTSFRNSVEVFYRPGECFEELREDPRILAPYALFCVLIAAVSFMGTSAAIAGETELTAAGLSFCTNMNFATQNAARWWFAYCLGDGFSWYSGY